MEKLFDVNFYKEAFYREIDRKHELNNTVGTPFLFISGIITVNVYFFTLEKSFRAISLVVIALTIANLILLFYSIFLLYKSLSNNGKSFEYLEIPTMSDIYDYEKAIKKEQEKLNTADEVATKNTLLIVNEFLCNKYSEAATQYFNINKLRTETIAKSKKYIFFSMKITSVITILIFFNLTYVSMSDKQEKPAEPTKPTSTVPQPQSVLIKNTGKLPKIDTTSKKGNNEKK